MTSDPSAPPRYQELILPTLKAVKALGGSGSISEIVESVVTMQDYTDEQLAVIHDNGPRTEIEYRLAWARTYLKGMGLLTNSERGVWSMTDVGAQFLADESRTDEAREVDLREMRREFIRTTTAARAERALAVQQPTSDDDIDGTAEDIYAVDFAPAGEADLPWKERLIAVLTSPTFSPASFERLAQRLLREADFESVTVLGRSGDQGIDGVGIYRLGLITFPVFFQCKRYSGTVDPHQVRDFRGAMAGRGEKGLLITTGRFTAEAKREASRDGAVPIELIDGDKLCDLLKRYDLGVRTTIRQVEDVTVDPDFFAEF